MLDETLSVAMVSDEETVSAMVSEPTVLESSVSRLEVLGLVDSEPVLLVWESSSESPEVLVPVLEALPYKEELSSKSAVSVATGAELETTLEAVGWSVAVFELTIDVLSSTGDVLASTIDVSL